MQKMKENFAFFDKVFDTYRRKRNLPIRGMKDHIALKRKTMVRTRSNFLLTGSALMVLLLSVQGLAQTAPSALSETAGQVPAGLLRMGDGVLFPQFALVV